MVDSLLVRVSGWHGQTLFVRNHLQLTTGKGGFQDIEALVFPGVPALTARLAEDLITGSSPGDEAVSFRLRRGVRRSPTLGAKAPPGATVLFDGKTLDGWARVGESGGLPGWKLVEGDAMEVVGGSGSIMTKKSFRDVHLHLEFRTPFMPTSRGQARGNRGVYLQGRYEIEVLDSYGLAGEDNECGGIYKVAKPLVNMCTPPGPEIRILNSSSVRRWWR